MEEFDDLRRRYETAPRELDERLRARLRDQAGATSAPNGAPVTPAWTWVAIGIGAPLAGLLFYLLAAGGWTHEPGFLAPPGAAPFWPALSGLMLMRGRTETVQPEAPAKTEEQLILEQGPLVLAHLVRADERLWQPRAPPGPGAATFSLEKDRRFDRTYLDRLVGEIQVLRGGTMPDISLMEVWRIVNSESATTAA